MCANARTYNEPGSWVAEDADALQAGMDQAWNEKVYNTGVPGSEQLAEASKPVQAAQVLGAAAQYAVPFQQPPVAAQPPPQPQPQPQQMMRVPLGQNPGQMPNSGMQHAMYQAPADYGGVDPGAFIADPMYYQQQAFNQQQQQQAAYEQQQQQQMYQTYSADPYAQQPE